MSCTQRPVEVMSSFPTRAGQMSCCRLWSAVGTANRDSGPSPVASPHLVHLCGSQGNQMSIAFLELAYPSPGQVHRGQLQLVEVSRAGLEPSKGPKAAASLF